MSSHRKRNIAADWFRASAATGDFMGIRYGRVSVTTGDARWFHVSHCECDGIGGFARLLREQGADIPHLPETKTRCRGVILPLWRLWRDRRHSRPCAMRGDWQPAIPLGINRPEDVAWHLFTAEETLEIINRCRGMKVTVNSFLLRALDLAVRREIRRPEATIAWMIPVNLRGDVQYSDDTQNHVSCVDAHIAADDTPQSINHQILGRLRRGEHRANHLLLTLGGIMSHRAKVAYLKKERAKPAGNIGSFSNLGVWNPDAKTTGDDAWVFCPPVVAGQLLSAGAVTFHGRLGLATLGNSAATPAARRMDRWLEMIRTL